MSTRLLAEASSGAAPPETPLRLRWWLSRPVHSAAAGIVLAVGLAVVWYLASPLFIRTRLVEVRSSAPAESVLARGAFGERDAIHRGSGTASLLRGPDGGTILQFDQFSVTNGPDLYVYLTPHAAPNSHDDVVEGGLQLGRLKASEGAFSYELPAGVDAGRFKAAVIYCYRFRTIFSVAPLARA